MQTHVGPDRNNPNDLVYDPESWAGETTELKDLVDPAIIYKLMEDVLAYMAENNMAELRETNNSQFEQHMDEQFPDYSERYYAIFRMVISGQSLDMLFNMLEQIEKARHGQISVENAEKNVGKVMRQKFINNEQTRNGVRRYKKPPKGRW